MALSTVSTLFEERGLKPAVACTHQFRIVDGTLIKKPGPTGAQWRVHYSLRWPALRCDYFRLSPVEGEGNGESLRQFPLEAGDYTLADRGYCHASGIHYPGSFLCSIPQIPKFLSSFAVSTLMSLRIRSSFLSARQISSSVKNALSGILCVFNIVQEPFSTKVINLALAPMARSVLG